MEVDWERFLVKTPDRAALMPLLRELEFTGLIKEYLPEEAAPTTPVVERDTLPDVGDKVFLDFEDSRMSIWAGGGEVTSVPLSSAAALLTNPAIRKVPYDLKGAIVKAATARA